MDDQLPEECALTECPLEPKPPREVPDTAEERPLVAGTVESVVERDGRDDVREVRLPHQESSLEDQWLDDERLAKDQRRRGGQGSGCRGACASVPDGASGAVAAWGAGCVRQSRAGNMA
jgi:hypothetical protein